MDLPIITRANIDEWRAYLKEHEPYDESDPILTTYDAKSDPCREKATIALRLLKAYVSDPYDDNDYGNIEK